jgi:Protein of unknown function (DUF2726)
MSGGEQAIEYHGRGHYQGTAAARDTVKKEALRQAGVRYIEVTPEIGTAEMTREILRIAQEERLKGSEYRQSRAADPGSPSPVPPTRARELRSPDQGSLHTKPPEGVDLRGNNPPHPGQCNGACLHGALTQFL